MFSVNPFVKGLKISMLFREFALCDTEDNHRKCQKPENLKWKPEECTPEQIKKCHGDIKEHNCAEQIDTSNSKTSGTRLIF